MTNELEKQFFDTFGIEAKMLLNFDKLVADCARYKTSLKEIDKN